MKEENTDALSSSGLNEPFTVTTDFNEPQNEVPSLIIKFVYSESMLFGILSHF